MFKIFVTLLFLTLSQHVVAKENVSIALNIIDGLSEPPPSDAPYNQIISIVTKRLGDTFALDLHYYPAVRAATQFESARISCLFPSSKVAHSTDFNIIESIPINVAKAYFFGKKLVSTSRVLDIKRPPMTIAYRRGYIFGGKINELTHNNLIETDSEEQALQLTLKGRADVIISYMPDFGIAQRLVTDEPLKYDASSHFYSQKDAIVCSENEQTVKFVKAANNVLQDLHESGEMAKILGDWYMDYNH